jgi:hypothetical protein
MRGDNVSDSPPTIPAPHPDAARFLATGGKPLYLLHCLKTAGTSLINYFVRLHGRGNCQLHYGDAQSVPLLLQSLANPAERNHHRASHLPLAYLSSFMEQVGRDHFHWMTCARAPLARQVSLYHYLRGRQDRWPVQAQTLDFSSLESFIDSTPRNSQCRFFHSSGTAEAALEALDGLEARIIPLPFLGLVIDAIYAEAGVRPLAPIRANRSYSDEAPISDTARAMITERFQQDQLLYDTCYQRVAPLFTGFQPAMTAVETLTTPGQLSSNTGPLYIFGTSAVGQSLCNRLDQAGIAVNGFLDSRGSQGQQLLGRPVLRPDALEPGDWPGATVLIAAEAYGPLYRTLAAHGCGRIIDAFDFAHPAEIA